MGSRISGFSIVPALTFVVGTILAGASPPAASSVIMHSVFGENDCPGFFSTDSGFSSCQIFWDPTDPDGETTIELSPVIAQFDSNFTVSDINTLFDDTVDGSEWTITSSATGEGTWEYNPDALDPGIRYWSAFGGNAFKLFWEVSDDAATSGACSDPNSVFNLDCLNEALVVEAGDWSTPTNPNSGQLFELSHLTFYDTEPPTNGPPPEEELPVPGTLALLIGGLGVFGGWSAFRRERGRPHTL